MSQVKKFEKVWLVRALITKILTDRQLPNVSYATTFYGDYQRLMAKIIDRKKDLPSLEYVVKTYTFEALETELTVTDIIEELDRYYLEEGVAETVQTLIVDAKARSIPIQDMLDKVQQGFATIRRAVTKAYDVDLSSDSDKIVEEYIKVSEGGSFIKTGFKQFDNVVCPKTGNLMLLCAPTKGGKTTSGVKMLTNLMEQGIPTMYFSLEMGLIEIVNRIITNTSEYTFRQLHFGKVSPEDYKKEVEKVKTKTHIITRQNESRIDIPTIERYIAEHHPKVVFVDYLSLIDGANMAWDAAVSPPAELKRIALQYDCFVVLMAQADTETMKNEEVPKMTNLRGNKGHAFDCDIFLGVRGLPYFQNDGDDRFRYMFEVSGSRNGGMPSWDYKVYPNRGSWLDSTDDGLVNV